MSLILWDALYEYGEGIRGFLEIRVV